MISPSQFEVQSEFVSGTAQLTVSGELDVATVPRLRQEAHGLLARSAQKLLIDLSGLSFIDSSGLSLLISLHDRAVHEGWQLSLTRPSAKAFSVFTISGADLNLPFVEDRESE
jgi:anti-sigma B factor antagonist